MNSRRFTSSVLFILFFAMAAQAQDNTSKTDAAGTVSSPAARFPFSVFASKEALARFGGIFNEGKAAPPLGQDIQASRTFYDKINSDRAERMKKLYPVEIAAQKFAGVAADVVTPKGGVDARNTQRVLINLHGGAFLWGAGSGGLVEAIPVASVGKIKVITVDYRQGPEHTFPAASEDVEKVYRELLKTYKPQNIGIYGCSAGGALTAEAITWLQTKNLSAPGAIGIFCAGVVDFAGDSAYIGHLLMGESVPEHAFPLTELPYFSGADPASPLVVPGVSREVLTKFPPTLLVSGSRDFAMSAALRSNELLTEAGVKTELHVWEGMWHSFFSDPELPESKAMYAVVARFFDRELGRAGASNKRH
ncbi:alpha/beta hydrolase [Rudaea cellulosilytica]|uniref:alpha/beta hydrolase n=1 Tax=Rudaea cellulosilytica TaxID=540746 RepID=UPI0003A5C0D3|nr:alpha/beta hydrolase [Rudaea cellulosilytica]